MSISQLSSKDVYRNSALAALETSITSTKHLEPLDKIIGQERAQQAVEFAISIQDKGYNIYALGQNGLGKRTMVLRYLNKQTETHNGPIFDWCYVANFTDSRQPVILKLPAGMAMSFKKDIEKVLKRLVKSLPMTFDNEVYISRSEKLKNQLEQKQQAILNDLTLSAQKHNISLVITTQGEYQLVPVDSEGQAFDEAGYLSLSSKEQKTLENKITELEIKLRNIIRQLTQWEEDFLDKIQKLDEQIANEVIQHSTSSLLEKYNDIPQVKQHIKDMCKDILENLDIFTDSDEDDMPLSYAVTEQRIPRRYIINVLVNQEKKPFPIIVEENPTYHTLFGYIENATFKGTVFTDFSLIRPGSLHQANGGVLMMDATKVLERPYVWDGLKRALRANELNLNSLEREVSLTGVISLEPTPIPLSVKIILFGDYHTYQLLQIYDPEFKELFRVTADFEDVMPRDDDSELLYAQFIAGIIKDNKMLHCDRRAISRIIEYSSRQSDDQNKLSLHSLDIANLLRESNYCAKNSGSTLIRAHHVSQALENKEQRASRLRDQLLQSFINGQTLIDIEGEVIGQINALSVLATVDHQFGIPGRITATTAFGKGEIFDIERQVTLGGNIHSKGVLILTAYLTSIFAELDHIPLSTSITFEQSYGDIDGDSATIAECCAIISAYAQLPLRQDIAITGSMNQFGHAQPIGGVNEKIEGFFDVCVNKQTLKGQGVIIPKANLHNLMLRKDIILAIEKQQFNIWTIEHVKDAIAILTSHVDEPEQPFDLVHRRLNALRKQAENKSIKPSS